MKKTMVFQMGTWALIGALSAACSQPREAAFPATDAPEIHALSAFNSLDVQSQYTVRTQNEGKAMSAGEAALATSENGLVAIDTENLSVPVNFKYMFEELHLQGTPDQTFRVAFIAGRNNITVYKIVDVGQALSTLEKSLVTTPARIKAELALQKTSKMSENNRTLSEWRQDKTLSTGPLYVPLFQFPVEKFGVVQRVKNELKEETSTLQLGKSSWAEATHVKVSQNVSARKLFGLTEAFREKSKDVYLAQKIHGQMLSGEMLFVELGLLAETIQKDQALRLILDKNQLLIQTKQDVDYVTAYEVSVVFKKAVLPALKMDGSRASTELDLEDMPAGQVSELVQIKKDSIKAVQ